MGVIPTQETVNQEIISALAQQYTSPHQSKGYRDADAAEQSQPLYCRSLNHLRTRPMQLQKSCKGEGAATLPCMRPIGNSLPPTAGKAPRELGRRVVGKIAAPGSARASCFKSFSVTRHVVQAIMLTRENAGLGFDAAECAWGVRAPACWQASLAAGSDNKTCLCSSARLTVAHYSPALSAVCFRGLRAVGAGGHMAVSIHWGPFCGILVSKALFSLCGV